MREYEFHALAEIFPLIDGKEFEDLVADIGRNGLVEPIILYEGKIIDGRNRYLACKDNGVEPIFRTYAGDDPASYVISLNLKRRHLNESQRGMVAAKLATLQNGGDRRRSDQTANLQSEITRAEAAELLNVSERTVNAAKKVQQEGVPELAKAVERGKISVSAAANIATQPRDRQQEISSWNKRDILNAAKVIRADDAKVKHTKRLKRAGELAQAESELANDLLFPILYADPPWRFKPYSEITGMDRAADNHYPTMCIEDILALEPPCTEDAALFLWATAPMLPQALDTLAAWGFAYKSHLIWVKDRIGTGYWARNKHELLLIGTRGSIPAPLPGTQTESVIHAPVAEHSRKPVEFHEIIERIYPGVPKLEMFARSSRPGWHVWGKETDKFSRSAA